MLARQEKLLDFLGEPSARFRIPVFQRSYTWQKVHCDELWRDIMQAAEGGYEHFTGSLLYLCEEGDSIRQIVDGQQRLVTVSLLIAALCDYLEEHQLSLDGSGDAQSLRSKFLQGDDAPKLTLGLADRATFDAVVSGRGMPLVPAHRILENLDSFKANMAAEDFDPQRLWNGLSSLHSIVVELDSDDASQDIFESFNSKGVQLTTADLCRNYLLIPLAQDEQTRIYEEYWEPMQDLFGDDPGSLRLNNAILGWLTIRFRRIRAKGDKQAFFVFKRYMREEYTGTVEQLLTELGGFCKVWAENYRYHAVKAYKSAGNWATLGAKTLVSDRPLKEASPEAKQYYRQHFNVDLNW